MPICNQCKAHSNCLTVDPCEFCGSKDWDPTTVITPTNMPLNLICKNCGKAIIGTHATVCPQCGTVDWKPDAAANEKMYAQNKRSFPSSSSSSSSDNGCFVGVVMIVVGLGALWGLIALIHWMWNHSG
jgi:hypothetical protein